MYDVYAFNGFIADEVRTEAYVAALRAAVRPGDTVLDLGAGTGFFAILACKLGARRVYAIDSNDALQLGPELAAANDCADRVEFIHQMSTQVTLPELADVLICDLRGTMPWYGPGISSIIDARHRLVRPGGTLIPQKDELWAAVVEAPSVYDARVSSLQATRFEVDQQPTRRFLVNTWFHAEVQPEQYLTAPAAWTTLDYTRVEDPNPRGKIEWTAERSGTSHGVSVWFNATIGSGEGASFSTAPGGPQLVYGNPFFPFEQPVELAAGDKISFDLRADLTAGDYIWSWDTQVTAAGGDERIKARYRQSTFKGNIVSLDRLRKQAAGYVPRRNVDGEIDALVLSLMDGNMNLEQIAQELSDLFPDRFTTWKEALTHAGEVSVKYG
jgi:protein arginine N-methyltransferase 1